MTRIVKSSIQLIIKGLFEGLKVHAVYSLMRFEDYCGISGLEVYVEVLKRQEKYGEALKLLDDLSGDLFTIATDRLRLQVCKALI